MRAYRLRAVHCIVRLVQLEWQLFDGRTENGEASLWLRPEGTSEQHREGHRYSHRSLCSGHRKTWTRHRGMQSYIIITQKALNSLCISLSLSLSFFLSL